MKRTSYSCACFAVLSVCTACVISFLLPQGSFASLEIESTWGHIPSTLGKPFHLTVSIRWSGEAGRYTIGTPSFELPDGISLEGISSSSYSVNDETYVTYTATVSATKYGSYDPIPISLPVYTREEQEPSTMVVKTDSISVDRFTWKSIPRAYLVAAAVTSLTLLSVAAVWMRRISKRKKQPVSEKPALQGKDIWDLLCQSRAYLVRGDSLSFLESVHTIERALQGAHTDALRDLDLLIEEVRYGGHRPQPEELERRFRNLKLRVQERFPREQGEEDDGRDAHTLS